MASCSRFLPRTFKSTDVARMFPLFQGPNGRIAISFVLFLIFLVLIFNGVLVLSPIHWLST